MLKIFSPEIIFLPKPRDSIWSHDSKMVWHLYIANIFYKYLVKNIFQNVFSNFLEKIFTKNIFKSVIPFWNRETKCHHMALIKSWFEDFFFNIQRGDPLDLQKRFLQCGGGNFARKKILQNQKFLKYVQALLSASGWNPKLHSYHPPLPVV